MKLVSKVPIISTPEPSMMRISSLSLSRSRRCGNSAPPDTMTPKRTFIATPSVVGDPGRVERCLDAAMARLDHVGRHRADEGVEGLRADRVDDALADLLRIDAGARQALRQHRLVV